MGRCNCVCSALAILSISKSDAEKWERTEQRARLRIQKVPLGEIEVTVSSVDLKEISALVRMARKWQHEEKV